MGSRKWIFPAVLFSLLFALFPCRASSGEESAVSLYKRYLEAAHMAIESESKGDQLAALDRCQSALEWLRRSQAIYPDWFPDIVGSRIAECRSNIERISGGIVQGTQGDMEIPPELATEAMGRKVAVGEGIYSGIVDDICHRADDLYENGQYADARREYEMALKLDPDNPRANFQLGLIYSEHIRDEEKMAYYWGKYKAASHSDIGDLYSKDGRYLTAIEEYGEALKEAPDNISVRRRLADVYFEQMRYPEAVQEYGAVLAAEPGDLHSRFRLARIHAELGSADKAISDLDFIRKRDSDYPGLDELYAELKAKTGDGASAITFYKKVIGGGPDDIGPYLELAKLYEKEKGDLEGAVEILARGSARFPESGRIAHEMGRSCVRLGDCRKARAIYEGLLEKSPDDADAVVGLGIISLEEDDREKAETYFKKALEIRPDFPPALFHLALCRESNGDSQGAVAFLEKAVAAGTEEEEAYRKLIDLYAADGENERAASTLQQAIERWPGASDMRKRLIAIHMAGGRKDAAIKELKRYVKWEGGDASAFLDLGSLYYERGQEGEALSVFKEALRLDPGIKGLAKKVAVLHQRRGEYEPAVAAYLGAIEEEPDSPVIRNNIAVCYAKSGKFREAIEEYEKVLALDSNFAEVHIDLAKLYGEQMDDPGKTIEHCCKYLQLRPDGEHASLAKEMLLDQREVRDK